MTRSEHLKWCKDRALEYLDRWDVEGAFNSMASDLSKHDETRGHSAIMLGLMLRLSGHLDSAEKMRKFIEGFN